MMDGIADLAQACLQPGLWEIEGIQVRRQRRRPALGQTFETLLEILRGLTA